jgi:hypothetical protein
MPIASGITEVHTSGLVGSTHLMRQTLTLASTADSFEERVRCCILAALEAESFAETVVLAECRHRLEELIPLQLAN